VNLLTQVRLAAGTAAMLAVAAVLAVALGAMLRRSAIAVTVVIAAVILPFLVAVTNVLPAGADNWLMRLAPAPASRSSRPFRTTRRSATSAGWRRAATRWRRGPGSPCSAPGAAAAMGLALVLLRRRDA